MPDQFIFKIFSVILFLVTVESADTSNENFHEDKTAFLEVLKKRLMKNNDDYGRNLELNSKYDKSYFSTTDPFKSLENNDKDGEKVDSRAQPLVMRQVSNKYHSDLSEFEDFEVIVPSSDEGKQSHSKHYKKPLNKHLFPFGAKKYFQGEKIFIWNGGTRRKESQISRRKALIEPYVRPAKGVHLSTQSIFTIPVHDYITGPYFKKPDSNKPNSKSRRRFYNLAEKGKNDKSGKYKDYSSAYYKEIQSLYARGSDDRTDSRSKVNYKILRSQMRDKTRTRRGNNKTVFINLDDMLSKYKKFRRDTTEERNKKVELDLKLI